MVEGSSGLNGLFLLLSRRSRSVLQGDKIRCSVCTAEAVAKPPNQMADKNWGGGRCQILGLF